MSFLLVHAKLNLTELDADSICYWIVDVSMFRSVRRFDQVLAPPSLPKTKTKTSEAYFDGLTKQ